MRSPRSVGWFLQRYFQRFNLTVQRIAKLFCHVVVKSNPSDDGCFNSESTSWTDADAVCSQSYNMLASEITGAGNAVNYKLFPIGQIDKNWLLGNFNSHLQNSIHGEEKT